MQGRSPDSLSRSPANASIPAPLSAPRHPTKPAWQVQFELHEQKVLARRKQKTLERASKGKPTWIRPAPTTSVAKLPPSTPSALKPRSPVAMRQAAPPAPGPVPALAHRSERQRTAAQAQPALHRKASQPRQAPRSAIIRAPATKPQDNTAAVRIATLSESELAQMRAGNLRQIATIERQVAKLLRDPPLDYEDLIWSRRALRQKRAKEQLVREIDRILAERALATRNRGR